GQRSTTLEMVMSWLICAKWGASNADREDCAYELYRSLRAATTGAATHPPPDRPRPRGRRLRDRSDRLGLREQPGAACRGVPRPHRRGRARDRVRRGVARYPPGDRSPDVRAPAPRAPCDRPEHGAVARRRGGG